jgi:hypothetical protein
MVGCRDRAWNLPLDGVAEEPGRRGDSPIYCAHTVPTIFTPGRHEPLVENASLQVRGTLSSMTVDDLSAGIIPGLQTSPSASPPRQLSGPD